MRQRKVLAALLACAAIGNANAQSADSGWYGILQYGRADYDVRLESGTWWGDIDDSTHEVGIGVGYDFLPQLGARVMYHRTWDVDAANICPPGSVCPAVIFREDTVGNLWSASLLPTWPLNDQWSLYATLGVLRWDLEPDRAIGGDSGTEFLYGAGVAYSVNDRFSVSVEYERANVDYASGRVGLIYRW